MSAAGTFSIQGDLPLHLVEVETFSSPGTADVTAGDRKKLSGLLKHYAAMAHPFTTCVKDQIKHGLSKDHANRRCAVIKDLIRGNTKWRGKAKEEEALADVLAEALNFIQVAMITTSPRTVAAILHEERLEEGEADLLFAVADHELSEAEQIQRAEEVLRTAAALVEAAPRWMIPVAARRPGFRPVKRQSGSSAYNEAKHRRAPKGSPGGGRFIRMGSTGSEVAAIQRRIGAAETGTFNQQTKEKLEAFQRRKGIQVDGVVGTQTANAMHGNTSVAPGHLTKHDRRFFRRYGKRTSASSTAPPSADRRRRPGSASSSARPKPIASPSEDSLPERRAQRLARQGWDYHDGMWWPPGHPRNRKGSSSRRVVRTRRTVTRA